MGNFPKELEYITSFYDDETGSSGSFSKIMNKITIFWRIQELIFTSIGKKI